MTQWNVPAWAFGGTPTPLYVRVRSGTVASTEVYSDEVLVDLDEDGTVLGAEFLGSWDITSPRPQGGESSGEAQR